MRRIHVIGAGALLSLVSLAGCGVVKGPEYGLDSCLYVGCPAQTCTTMYAIDTAALQACFGWDPDQQTWGDGTPEEVANCIPGTECNVRFEASGLPADAVCAWGDVNDVADPSACSWTGTPAESTEGADFAAELAEDCGAVVAVPTTTTCTTPEVSEVLLTTACDTCNGMNARTSRPPGTTATLVLDAARSFLGITTAVQSVSVPLSGTGFADLPAGRLLGVQVTADRARLVGSDWSGWSFGLAKAVPLARSGDGFRIPMEAKPTVVGAGRRDGQARRIRAAATRDVSGHLWAPQGAWDLHFEDQSAAGGFVMHLAGRIGP